jgi:hypothetical protein
MTEASKPRESADADLDLDFLNSGCWFATGKLPGCLQCTLTRYENVRSKAPLITTNIGTAHTPGNAYTLPRALIYKYEWRQYSREDTRPLGLHGPWQPAWDTRLICSPAALAGFRVSYACSLP